MKRAARFLPVIVISLLAVSQAFAAAPKSTAKDKKASSGATASKIIASCDVPDVGSCYDFTDKAKEKSETLCSSMRKKPVVTACTGEFIGSCEFPEGYFRRFQKSGSEAWELKAAQDDCKQSGGTWR